MQLRLPGIAVQRFARVFSAGEINSNCRKIRLIKNSGATIKRKRAARTVLTGMCYSVGSATRQGSSSPTRFIGQSAMTSRT
ncbi:hypothetical protein E2865_00892 [Escherichia coli]|nr:Uncharacterised protein [Escherichia coli]STK07316.1 Uncharacterised protein [Escherichia coli]STN46509.1 Uncharacterised protein [Escherichia coli]BBF58054.1 hypothetical protein E2865_00892 [Escherichia coli]BDV54391.1 hypothetical protein T2313_3093 [Escherichia coli]